MRSGEKKTGRGRRIHLFDVVLAAAMGVLCIIFIYPFVNIIAISLSSNVMIGSGRVTWFPRELNPAGYRLVFGKAPIYLAYLNTLKYCLLFALVNVLATAMIAYALAQNEFACRKGITVILLITMFFSGGTVPTYLVVSNLKLMDTAWALVLPTAVSAYNVFVYRAFFKGIAGELREAARIDGAGEYRILFRIIFPLSKPLFATFGLFAVVGMWNNYMEPLLYIRDAQKQPIQMVLRNIIFQAGGGVTFGSDYYAMADSGMLNPKNVQYAAIVAATLPIMIFYPFLQKYFVQGVQVGAVKG